MTAKDDNQAPWDDVPDPVTHGDGLDWDDFAAKAVRRESLIARLEKCAAYTPDNSQQGEYANAQAAIKKLKAEILALTPTEVAPLPGLSDILERIIVVLSRFIVLKEAFAQVIALWIVHTHIFLHQIEDQSAGVLRHIFDHTPRLIVYSPTHGSGKSTLAELIGRLAANVESISSLTGSELKAFMRCEAEKRNDPLIQKAYNDNGLLGLGLHTYLLDEAEQYKYTGLLMRLLNAGHRHDGQAWDGKGGKISLFAPTAAFRRFDPRYEPELAPTVSRAILIPMERRDPQNPDHKREPVRARNPYVRQLPLLKQQIERVVARLIPEFADWRPEANFLEGNRNADNWEPLIAIADLAGGDWPIIARELAEENARELEKREAEEAATSYGENLVHHGNRPPRTPRSTAEELNVAKEKIMVYLGGGVRRCSRSDLHKWVFSNNLKAEILHAAITALEAEGKIRTAWQRTSTQSGRAALMVELIDAGAEANSECADEDLRGACKGADTAGTQQPGDRPVPFTDKKIMDALHESAWPL